MSHAESTVRVELDGLDALVTALQAMQYTVVGPTLRNGASVIDELHSANDLPRGYADGQEAGTYRIAPAEGKVWLGFTVGPHSWKKYLFPPVLQLFSATRDSRNISLTFDLTPDAEACAPRYAFFGVRACELAVEDLRQYVSTRLNVPEKKIPGELDQSIRNCDPCISCATHFLKLEAE